MRMYRAAIIGCTGIGREHAAGLTGLNNVDLVAACDLNLDAVTSFTEDMADFWDDPKPYTDHLTNPAATLHKAGIKIGFIVGDSKQNTKTLFTNLINLVRHGLDPDVALKAVTIVPAEMLGIAKDVGSIKVGKDANLILFDGDPLDPITTLKKVWYKGQVVEKEKER